MVNKLSVSVIDYMDKNVSKSGGVEKKKDHDAVISNKCFLDWSEEEISNDFDNQVLSETIASMIDELEKNVVCGVVVQWNPLIKQIRILH